MIERLITSALRFRALVIGGTVALIAGGVWSFVHLRVDAFPDLTPNQVDVLTAAPGLSPNEVENLVTYPVESAMMGLPRTTKVRSISKSGISIVTVSFEDNVDLYFARAQVQQRMQDAAESLPDGLHPTLGPAATPMGEVYQYLVESESASLIELRNLQDYTIKPLLRTIPGVADISQWGGMVQQFQAEVDPAKLASYGLTLDDVVRALGDNNGNFGAGYIETRGERFTVRGLGRVAGISDIEQVVVSTRSGGTPIFVRDLAEVAIGPMPREGAVSRDGRGEALSGKVIMLKGSNGREVVRAVEARLAEARSLMPRGVTIRPFYSQGDVVDHTTATVFRNLLEGGLLVVLILFLFLRNIRASLITASVIPLSLLIAFVAMKQFGVSANLMSLGALDFGLLVDASVVMVENFVRRMESAGGGAVDRRSLIREAAVEVGRPIVFGVCIIVAVYVPIFSLEGLEGRMFAPMAFTVCVAVLGSLLLALTYVPIVSSFVLSHAAEKKSRWFEALKAMYGRHLNWALRHGAVVVGVALVLLVAAVGSVPYLGTEFMPELDEGSILLETRRLPSTSLPQGMAIAKDVENTLLQFPEISSVVTNMGRPELATEAMGLYAGDVYVNFKPGLKPKIDDMEAFIEKIDDAMKDIPGLDYNFSAPMAMRLDEAISGVRTELGVRVFGDNLDVLQQKAAEISAVIETVRGAADVSVDVSAGAMQLELNLDRAALGRLGMNVADVRRAVETGVGGIIATEVIDGRKRFPVVVRLAEPYRGTPEAIGQLLLTTPAGARVRLSDVATVAAVEGPELIGHENGERIMVVQSNVRGRDLGGFAAEVQREVGRRVVLPEGYFVTYGGQFENQQRAMRRLSLIVPAVLVVIIGLLYASFGNLRQSVLVMLNVPFALVGGIAALWIRGINLNLSASIGFIALFGVAVLNGVVLLSYINQLRDGGRSLMDAIREGAQVRFRPVLMTALVASFGFIPMALSTSQGAEVQRPLATVVIGGLATSTMLTLIVLPVLYSWVERRWGNASERVS